MSCQLENKIIVIIGGTTGLGLSAALACAEAGARVIALGRDDQGVAVASQRLGESGKVLTGDVTKPATALEAIDAAFP